MPRYTISNYTASQLAQMITPQSGDDLEALPWILFYTDTASFANAATNVQAVEFQTVQSDKTLSNIEAPGQLPIPQVLEIAGNTCDILSVPSSAATNIGALSDMANILKTARTVFIFKLSNKSYGIFPLTCAHATGGEQGFMASTVATAASQYANNGIFDGGWWVDGAIIIPSQQQFEVDLNTGIGVALTLTQTPTPVRFGLWGPIHRRVL